MNTKGIFTLLGKSGLLFGCLLSFTAAAAPVAATKPTATATNSLPVEIPKSVFVIPAIPKEGRDPFFPNSSRVYAVNSAKTKAPQTAGNLTFKLGVLSPKFATIINGSASRTLAPGEETEFNAPGGPYRVKCLEIKEASVIIEINGERRELRMRQGLQ
jgi:hypothetical protein